MSRFLCSVENLSNHIGFYVARKVYDDTGRLMLNINFQLNNRSIESMQKTNIKYIWLSDEMVENVHGVSNKNLYSLKSKQKELQKTFESVKKEIFFQKEHHKANISISHESFKKIEQTIESIINKIMENPFLATTLEPLQDEADFLVRHSVNTTYYGLCLLANYRGVLDIFNDKERGLSRFESTYCNRANQLNIASFGMSCFLHDIGKILILDTIKNDTIYDKESEEGQKVWELIKSHSQFGHDMLFGKGIDAHTLLGIKYHHENFDGSGYPFGVSGYKIHPFSRIIRVIDSFDAAISKGPGRPNKDFRTILGELLAFSGKNYDAEIVKYFIDLMLGGKSGLVSNGFVI